MNILNKENVEELKRTYPIGCRIALDHMDKAYIRIPDGARATVTGVDDAGNLICVWDCGSSFSLACSTDHAYRTITDDEKDTLT